MEKLKSGAKKLGLELTEEQVERFEGYYRELIDWNRRMNLTAITDYDEVQIKHFLDALTITLALKQLSGSDFLRVIDVGSGAGIPGLPLKIVMPGIRLALLEATAKKADFLNHVIERLGLAGVEVVGGRAEEIAHRDDYREKFDIALARGVAPLAVLVELTLPFLAIGGRLIAQKKGDLSDELEQAEKAIETLGGEMREIIGIEMSEFPDRRKLVVIAKVAPTPTRYPRRPGIPTKRPLV